MASGCEESCTRILLQASSSRSTALSGKKRVVMYRSESCAAATSEASWMLTPWCVAYRSLSPRRMVMVVCTEGSSTLTCWKRRSSAASFSMYLRYSSTVVAPMQRSSPRASMGFSRFAASMAPSVLPAPISKCASSMKRTIRPSASLTSWSTAFRRSSNSPRYLAPLINAPTSSATTRQFFKASGTSPTTTRCARPSTMAVFPTPGSPTRIGLFLVLRASTCTTRRISSSRPMTGSSFPFSASATRSRPYFESASKFSSAVWVSTFLEPRRSCMAFSTCVMLYPAELSTSLMDFCFSSAKKRSGRLT
mmetsp:Transcript_74057/g.176582  ORF Transcript_74057/g.176582 Transcript_74057/m.176582 type:complete len:307 (+) Transcript_74057:1416-2336(+)